MEPQAPQQAKKKGLGPVAWILIGCIGVLLLGALAVGACTFWAANKAKEFAEDPSKAVEFAIRMHPDLEMVEMDKENETITVRSKDSGEEMTFDWSDIQQGNFSFSSDEGTFEVNAGGDEDGAVVTMTNPDGEVVTQTYGPQATSEIPNWILLPESASQPQSSYSMRDGDKTSGALSFTTTDSVSEVIAFYVEQFDELGYEVSQSNFTGGGREGGMVQGEGDGRTMSVSISSTDEGTQATVTYSDG